MNERRNHQRIDLSLSGRFKPSEHPDDLFEATVVNLSSDGVSLVSTAKLEDGKQVEIDVSLAPDKHLRLEACVIWSNQDAASGSYHTGLRIVNIPQGSDKALLDTYYQENMNASKSRKKILVVDDEKDLVALLSFHLNQAGYEVVMAFDGEEGYRQYEQQVPDLIILDLKMPKLNGFEVCRKIRREKKDLHVPILMLTALQDDADRLIGKVVGAERYMTKPFKIEELLREVSWLVPNDAAAG